MVYFENLISLKTPLQRCKCHQYQIIHVELGVIHILRNEILNMRTNNVMPVVLENMVFV